MIYQDVGFMFQGNPELSEQAQRALQLTGELPLSRVLPPLGLSTQVEDWTNPEYLWLRRTKLHGFGFNLGSVVAQFAQGFLFVPAATPSIVVVESITITNQNLAVAGFKWGLVNTVAGFAAGVVGTSVRDSRYFGVASAATGGATTNAVQLLPSASTEQIFLASGASVTLPGGYVLTNKLFTGTNIVGFVIETVIVNSALCFSLKFRERSLLSTEQT